ncbi:hypothetical protein CYQ88_09070 [Hydrogenovibrio sp. SC-1]|uniref:PilZ domain-containing protein n=1 Tax=Hydrogenovibrio sp. SC-1 TaxID=2065820 RepID=UPI000C7A7E4E|nr:PilZ domain-containing protein [Hydrogenovibrio sp. SC-1]PLA73868.1 hypothetical protein CYQ88_09070 [Hydrogenovibrio sp. SC-1]
MIQPTFDIDKRNAERVSTERPITVQSNQSTITAKMIDLSLVGIGVLSEKPILEGNEIQITFSLPNINNKELVLCGIATRTAHVQHQYLIGIQFKDLSNYIQSVINDFIHSHQRYQ